MGKREHDMTPAENAVRASPGTAVQLKLRNLFLAKRATAPAGTRYE